MSFTSKGTSEILVAGLQDQMFTIDVNRGEVSKQVCTTEFLKDGKTINELDSYKRPVHNHETKPVYLCRYEERNRQHH
jgi:hypothetical protein